MAVFQFKFFSVSQKNATHKVGTDAMVLGAVVTLENASQVLDIGTGTGVLSLMLAQKSPSIQVDAIEIDQPSFLEAEQNVRESNYKTQIQVLQGDFLEFPFEKKYDLLVSNPPYFLTQNGNLDPRKSTARHALSLTPERLFAKAAEITCAWSRFYVIYPIESQAEFELAALEQGWYPNKRYLLKGKMDKTKRVITCFSKVNVPVQEVLITIRDEQGKYTDEYKELTKEYHSKTL